MEKPIKVLMVDDEKQFRITTRKILNRRGFDTVLAESGPDALEKLVEKPDVIVLDVKMPGMDGHEVLKEIKKTLPDTPVIMLTGHGAAPSAREALREGAFDYLTKPCAIDILAAKIGEAYHHLKTGGKDHERRLVEVMVPLEDYTALTENQTVGEGIEELKRSFMSLRATEKLMETGHRSILVFNRDREDLVGVVTIVDLMRKIMPAYLTAPKPSTADSIQYSPMFWTGMFGREVKKLAGARIGDIMSPPPTTIDERSNLMEAAYMMVFNAERRLAVVKAGKVIGIVREQDLFFEMERILKE